MLRKAFFSLYVLTALFPYSNVYSKESTEVRQLYPDFTVIAEKVIPAVVSIKVQYSVKSPFSETADPFEGFGNEFWQHFFGLPKRDSNAFTQPQVVGQGSGVIVSADGYILTNNHIVKDADKITVTLTDGHEYTGKIVGQDQNTDLAVIKVDAQNLPFLKLGDSDALKVGQWVLAVGNPLGLQATLTAGIVSAKDRTNLGLAQFEDFIQTDASINKGNSGGALVNLDGDLVGIPTAIATSTGGYMGIGFAIPSSMASQIMEQLINSGSVSRGFLGIVLQKVDQNLATAFGMDKATGALVAEVAKESAAEKAGLKPGDIIIRYNGTKIDNISHFRNAVSFMKPGTIIQLDILREKKPISLRLELGDHPGNALVLTDSTAKLGIQVEALTPEQAKTLGYVDDKGVVVSKVASGSLGELAGIKKGSLILEVNHQKVTTPEQFYTALKSVEPGSHIPIYIKQGNRYLFVSIRSE